jgi:CheY-like chemotaxis protein
MLLDLFSVSRSTPQTKSADGDDSTQPATILVAEDSLFFRKLIANTCRRDEWEVEVVNDGQEAYDAEQEPDPLRPLFISDINMPRMDGFELVKNVREDRRFDKLPIVALTTMSDDHFREKGVGVGLRSLRDQDRQTRSAFNRAECLRIKRRGRSSPDPDP